jgi:TonB family protein
MTERISHSLAVSVITHAALVVVAVLLLAPISKIEIRPAPTTSFVLVSSESRGALTSANNHEHKPLVSLPSIPRPAVRQPVVNHSTESASSTPVTIPTPSPASPTRSKPAVSGQPRMTFKDYLIRHGEKQPAENKINAQVAPPSFSKIDAPSLPNTAPSAQTDPVDDARSESFNAELIQRLRDAYRPFGAEDNALSCRIEFVLVTSGHIASSKILRSSGNPAFDNAVREALARVRLSTPPERLIGVPLTTTFQVAQ